MPKNNWGEYTVIKRNKVSDPKTYPYVTVILEIRHRQDFNSYDVILKFTRKRPSGKTVSDSVNSRNESLAEAMKLTFEKAYGHPQEYPPEFVQALEEDSADLFNLAGQRLLSLYHQRRREW